MKNVCSSKDTIKSQRATKWQKIFTRYISGQGAIARVYKEVMQVMIKSYDGKRNNWSFQNGQKNLTDISQRKILS